MCSIVSKSTPYGNPNNFETFDFQDGDWEKVPYWPYAHGGERHEDEDLFLRTSLRTPEFKKAFLNVETAKPEATVYLNGKQIGTAGLAPTRIDITYSQLKDQDNVIAAQVYNEKVVPATHMSTDLNSGVFLGRSFIDLVNPDHLTDIFVRTASIGDEAVLNVDVQALADKDGFKGSAEIVITPWYPVEDRKQKSQETISVMLSADESKRFQTQVSVKSARLWSPEAPNLYKVHVILKDKDGNAVDDMVQTTGIRTITQDGGVVRLNSKPTMLNGPLVFQHFAPLERVAQWMWAPPATELVRQILMVKEMNGNTIRMSVHESSHGGAHDPRMAELCDQLGMMLMWQSSAWHRQSRMPNFDCQIGLSYHQNGLAANIGW
jgi:hypothetical protein